MVKFDGRQVNWTKLNGEMSALILYNGDLIFQGTVLQNDPIYIFKVKSVSVMPLEFLSNMH